MALITGGSAGIGAAFADRLASRGYDLLLVARDPDRLHETARAVAARHGVRADVLTCDLATRRGVFGVAALLSGPEAPVVDVLVNNAGCEAPSDLPASYPPANPFPYGPVDDHQAEIDLDVTATMRITHAVLPGMIRRGSGTVVNVGGVAGWLSAPGSSYGPTKAWVAAFTDALARSLSGTGVQALAVCPGPVDTGWHGTERPAGAAGRLLWTDAGQVVDTALADLDAGRAVSVAGRVHRPLVGMLELPRRTLRSLNAGARAARRGAELLADVTREPLMPIRGAEPGPGAPATPAAGSSRPRRAVPAPGCGRESEPARAPVGVRAPSRLPDAPVRPGAGRAVATAGDCGRSEHFLAGGPRTARDRARAAAAARDRARTDRPVRTTAGAGSPA